MPWPAWPGPQPMYDPCSIPKATRHSWLVLQHTSNGAHLPMLEAHQTFQVSAGNKQGQNKGTKRSVLTLL
jgi:hypothetical protein